MVTPIYKLILKKIVYCTIIFSLSYYSYAQVDFSQSFMGSLSCNNKPYSSCFSEGKLYTSNEFPSWLKYIFRFEVILLGSLPFTYLISNLSYDYFYYWSQGSPSQHLPAPLGPGTSNFNIQQNNAKYEQLLIASFSFSLIIALIDLIIEINLAKKSGYLQER